MCDQRKQRWDNQAETLRTIPTGGVSLQRALLRPVPVEAVDTRSGTRIVRVVVISAELSSKLKGMGVIRFMFGCRL